MHLDFNPRGPLGPRPDRADNRPDDQDISIHAVLWDRDLRRRIVSFATSRFQSTRSSGTATEERQRRREQYRISIHAVLWDRDIGIRFGMTFVSYFNPRGPLGPRHNALPSRKSTRYFNPRGPLGPRRSYKR